MTERDRRLLAGAVPATVLLGAYVSTLAPDVTFWDSGEFIAAAKSFGIPHPPGTPLFVAALNAFARLWFFLPYAVRTNLFSAVCTAIAGGISGVLIAMVTDDWLVGTAAGITAGAMSTVWQSANETEVYAASLLLSIGALAAAWNGRKDSSSRIILAMYLLALAVPLHLSALVAAPAVTYLASTDADGATDWPRWLLLAGAATVIAGAGLASWPIACVGVAVAALALVVRPFGTRSIPAAFIAGVAAMVALGLSATLILLVRSRFDPAVNQANPSTFAQLGYTVARRQYEVAAIWPRQAPIWLQIANWFEYADWQFALGLAPTVMPTVGRILATVLFAALGAAGCVVHRTRDRRTWIALLLLFLGGSAGVMAYVNFKAGASFAWAILPDPAKHEARDRDYFFVLGFWVWGLWAAAGAAALARRWFGSAKPALLIAAVPLMLNWEPSRRNEHPESGLPRELGVSLLDPLPRRAVLFVAGDNDTYPLWFLQQVDGLRRDVTVVTIPLMGAAWYRDELDRRWGLSSHLDSRGLRGLLADVQTAARRMDRPVAVALTVPKEQREMMGAHWRIAGLVTLEQDASARALASTVDSAATSRSAESIAQWLGGASAHPSTDAVSEHFLAVLQCPSWVVSRERKTGLSVSLDSLCNLR